MPKFTREQLLESAHQRILANAVLHIDGEYNYECLLVQHRDGIQIKKNGNAYCSFGHQTNALVHRVVYEYHYGLIPQGLEVSHLCGNGVCVKLSHLHLEDHTYNISRIGCPGYCYSELDPTRLYLCCNHLPHCKKITKVPLTVRMR
jgi:hypothetical protein